MFIFNSYRHTQRKQSVIPVPVTQQNISSSSVAYFNACGLLDQCQVIFTLSVINGKTIAQGYFLLVFYA